MTSCRNPWSQPAYRSEPSYPARTSRSGCGSTPPHSRHHPEQALIDRDDLTDRMAEPWFNPNGFFVATIDGHHGRLPLDQAASRSTRRGLRARCRSVGGRTRTRQSAAAHRAALACSSKEAPA